MVEELLLTAVVLAVAAVGPIVIGRCRDDGEKLLPRPKPYDLVWSRASLLHIRDS